MHLSHAREHGSFDAWPVALRLGYVWNLLHINAIMSIPSLTLSYHTHFVFHIHILIGYICWNKYQNKNMFKQVFLFRWYLNTSSKLRKTKGEFQHKTKHHDSQRSTMIHYETHPVFLSCFLSMYCMLWTLNKLSIIFLTTMTKVWNTVKQKWLLKVPAGFKSRFSNAVKTYSNYSWIRSKGHGSRRNEQSSANATLYYRRLSDTFCAPLELIYLLLMCTSWLTCISQIWNRYFYCVYGLFLNFVRIWLILLIFRYKGYKRKNVQDCTKKLRKQNQTSPNKAIYPRRKASVLLSSSGSELLPLELCFGNCPASI
jgi:hypothetical protein